MSDITTGVLIALIPAAVLAMVGVLISLYVHKQIVTDTLANQKAWNAEMSKLNQEQLRTNQETSKINQEQLRTNQETLKVLRRLTGSVDKLGKKQYTQGEVIKDLKEKFKEYSADKK